MSVRSIPLRSRNLGKSRLNISSLNKQATRGLASASSDTTSTKEPDPSRVHSQPASKAIVDGPDNETSSLGIPGPSEDQIASYDPVARAKARGKRVLPPGRYNFRSPKYYRGPLHPHQPLPKSDPHARDFVPGPFSLPRLVQTYHNVLAPDLMTLFYQHTPPGTVKPPRAPRLREWDDSSPYHKNRPLRGPRGTSHLPLLRKEINFRNIPNLSKITIHTLVRDAPSSSAHLHVAGMIIQALTAQRATVHIAKKSSAAGQRTSFTQKERKPIAVGASVTGEQMWHIMSQLVSVVLPRIKDWKGMNVRAGDRSGNLQLGLNPEVVGLWPEIAVNYDAYPPEMIPGVDIVLHTTAAEDRDARVLLTALGLPFQRGGTG